MTWRPELRRTDEELSPEEATARGDQMTTKVTFDVNFLDKFHDATPEDREKILTCVRNGALEFFANYEALREVMGLAHTTRGDKIIPFARYILDLTGGKILNMVLDLVESELRGSLEFQMESASRTQIVRFLEQAAGGYIPSAAPTIGQAAINDKRKAKIDYDAVFNALEARFGALSNAERAKITFEEVRAGWWKNMGRKTIHRFCTDWGVPDPDGTADRGASDPARYPHVQTWARIFALMLHRYFILRRKRDKGDLFDLWQMIYLQDMDVYVTEERKLPDWYKDVFGSSRSVMNWDLFVSEKWC